MASKNKITEVLAAIKTIYPYYAKDADIQTLVKTWGVLLKEYPDEAVTQALYLCLQKCKMPPTPADMIEHLSAMSGANEPSDEELWEQFTKKLRQAKNLMYRFQFTFREANGKTQGQNARDEFDRLWESLPEKIKAYLGGVGEFQRLARNQDDEELKFERNRFLKTMPTIHKRAEYTQLQLAMGGAGAKMLEEGK